MKKIILTFGLISGAISALMMFITLPMVDKISFDRLEVIGYATIIASFLMVFFGIRSYRENVGGGKITFGKGMKVGLLITLISCACYVIAWQIIYYKITPDFAEKYGNYILEKARAGGASATELAAKREEIKSFKELLANPLINVAVTLLEPLPIGVLVTLISSAILRRKEPQNRPAETNVAAALL